MKLSPRPVSVAVRDNLKLLRKLVFFAVCLFVSGCHAWRMEAFASRSMATSTSTWCSSPTSGAKEMSEPWSSRAAMAAYGNRWRAIGAWTGKLTRCWSGKPSPSASPLVMAEPPHPWMLPLPTGVSARPLKALSLQHSCKQICSSFCVLSRHGFLLAYCLLACLQQSCSWWWV